MEDIEGLNYDDLSAVAKLAGTEHYKRVMHDVRQAIEASTSGQGEETQPLKGPLEDDPTYK